MGENIHEGHRKRLKKRFLEEGLDSFEPHEVVELLLYYAIPYKDTNALAHRLIEQFGGISGLMDAPFAELTALAGMGENTATLLKLIPAVSRRYSTERAAFEDIIASPAAAGAYLLPRFHGMTCETVLLLCLDAKGKALGVERLSEGDVGAALLGIRKAVSAALKYNATAAVLAHNHVSGVAIPSREDVAATERVRDALETVEVALLDHIVVAEDDFVSMAQSGLLRQTPVERPVWGKDNNRQNY